MASELDFEGVVTRCYQPLYQFAFSLTRSEADACDLTQQTFYVLATKGHQVRDVSKVKTWLFTTLYREFLESRRRQTRFPHYELSQVAAELPPVTPNLVNRMDTAQVLKAWLSGLMIMPCASGNSVPAGRAVRSPPPGHCW